VWGELLAEDEFGGAPSDIHHQPPFIRLRQKPRHALIDQAGLFGAGHHVDGVAQHFAAARQEFLAVAGFPQGLGGHCPDLGPGETCQPLAKSRQTGPAPLHGVLCQVPVLIQSVALAHGLLEVFHPLYVTELIAPDFKAKAVGAEVYRGEACAVLHGILVKASCGIVPRASEGLGQQIPCQPEHGDF